MSLLKSFSKILSNTGFGAHFSPHKIIWGFLSGLVIIIIKLQGADNAVFMEIMNGTALIIDRNELIVSSILVILLATISAPFCQNNQPVQILIFCASLPALLSIHFADKNVSPGDEPMVVVGESVISVESASSEQVEGAFIWPDSGFQFPSFVGTAYGQEPTTQLTCVEPNAVQQLGLGLQKFVSTLPTSELPVYSVVAHSNTSLDDAIAFATDLRSDGINAQVGCRIPGNEFFPVLIGQKGTLDEARVTIQNYVEQAVPEIDPYISLYEFREPLALDIGELR